MQFRGLYTAIVTPFTKGGASIDYDAYGRLVKRQVDAGVAGIVPCGTTGESPTLSHDEHSELIRRTVQLVDGKVQVVAGTGSNSTAEAIELTREACKDGVSAVMIVNPYYNKPTQEGLFQHFQAVAKASSVPVMLYNIRGRTAVNVEPETFVRMASIANLKAVKEASGDLGQMARIVHLCKDRFDMLSGDDNLTPAVMAVGGQGVVSVASNVYPRMLVRMTALYNAGDFKKGNEIFYKLLDFMQAMFWETNPIPVKAAVSMLGLCGPDIRLPMTLLSADKKDLLAKLMEETGEDQ
jgi:4-hydroxy-tetrahydrodipicolinate synthase